MVLWLAWSVSIAQKVKLHNGVGTSATVILTVGDLRLLRMQRQVAGRKALLDRIFQMRCLRLTATVANQIVPVTVERDVRKLPIHPKIERIVELEISQDGTDDTALRRPRRPLNKTTVR